jgi:hypothetical protein
VLGHLNVGNFWNNHHCLMHATDRVNGRVPADGASVRSSWPACHLADLSLVAAINIERPITTV